MAGNGSDRGEDKIEIMPSFDMNFLMLTTC